MKRVLMALAILALSGIALYALAGFLLAPRLVEHKLEAIVARDTGLTMAIEAAHVNPFTFSVTLKNVTLFRAQNTPVVSINSLDARLRPASIGARMWLIRDLLVRDLVVLTADGFRWRIAEMRANPRIDNGAQRLHLRTDLDVRRLDIAAVRGDDSVVSVPTLALTGMAVQTSPLAYAVDAGRIEGPTLLLRRSAAGEFNLPAGLLAMLAGPAQGTFTDITVIDGSIDYRDAGLTIPLQQSVVGVQGTYAEHDRGGAYKSRAISLSGRVGAGGTARLVAEWSPSKAGTTVTAEMQLGSAELSTLSPYVAAAIGRRIAGGRLDLLSQLSLEDSRSSLDTRLVVKDLEFGEAVTAVDASRPPLELAIALLDAGDGSIVTDVRVPDGTIRAFDEVGSAFVAALASHLDELGNAPFGYLAALTGRPDPDLGRIVFEPGSAEPDAAGEAKIATLARALELRPRLGMTAYPGYDPIVDRESLATRQIRLHVDLATSAGLPGRATGRPLDFDDGKVRRVLDEFAENRLPRDTQADIASSFPDAGAGYYRAVFDALVDNEGVTPAALERLGRYRARTIVDALVEAGTDASRLRQANEVIVADAERAGGAVVLDAVPLEPGGG